MLEATAVDDGADDVAGVGVSVACGMMDDVDMEHSDRSSGAGAWKGFPLGLIQSTSPSDTTAQHCHREVVGSYTISFCAWSSEVKASARSQSLLMLCTEIRENVFEWAT